MEKILLVIDALKPSSKAIDFACYIANLTHSKITGVFLENMLSSVPISGLNGTEFNETIDETDIDNPDEKRKRFDNNIHNFNQACENRNVLHAVHRDRGIPSSEIVEESRFADLIIVDPRTSFMRKYESEPTSFVKSILENTECPVILAPEQFEGIDKIIFAYDGRKSSAFAIRQFTHLFPQLKNKAVTVLQISEESNAMVKEKYKLNEWLKVHYSSIEMKNLQGDPKYGLVNSMMNEKNVLLVMGAYGKNFVSHFFHGSHADLIIKTADFPLFIAHN